MIQLLFPTVCESIVADHKEDHPSTWLKMSFRFALQKFLTSPQSHPSDVFAFNEEYVVVLDAFRKSEYHYLLCPRDAKASKSSPLDFVIEPNGIELIRKVQDHIIREYKTRFDLDIDESFIKVGCHAVPSLYNLHIHIITNDYHSESLKNKPHYNSFTTKFFISLDELPLAKNDERRNGAKMEELKKKEDLICVYCQENFRNKFKQLKDHLTVEFKELVGKPNMP